MARTLFLTTRGDVKNFGSSFQHIETLNNNILHLNSEMKAIFIVEFIALERATRLP